MTAWGSVAELLGEDFEDIEILGRGSSGSVYRATQVSLGRTVAVKVFRHFADDEADRVLSEARAQATLSWHANVVSLYSQGVSPDGFPYMVMEYAPGGSLSDRVKNRGALSEAEWRRMGAEMAGALAAAHDAGVIHCDVKPSNVLFAADGSARLADFGIARAAGLVSGTLDSLEGSLAYVPPELLDGNKPQPANDVYSLGLTLVFAATGEQPFAVDLTIPELLASIQTGPSSLHLDQIPASEELSKTIRAACSTRARLRPSAQLLRADLNGVGVDAGPTVPGDPGPARGSRHWRFVAVATVVALVGLLVVQSQREIEAPAPAAFDLCAEYESYTESRRELLTGVSADLEQSQSPYEVAERLLATYPTDFAELAHPFLGSVGAAGLVEGEVTRGQLAMMTQADNLRALGGGKPFLYDGEVGMFDPAALPVELHEPARMFSDVNELAAHRCPTVAPNLRPAKARMNSAIFSNLSDPAFMEGFFDDPRSEQLFDSRTALLIANLAWGFFENLLQGQWEWFFGVLDSNDDLRRALSLEHPEVLLTGATEDPSLVLSILQPSWRADLLSGFNRSTPASQWGMVQMYPEALAALDVEPT